MGEILNLGSVIPESDDKVIINDKEYIVKINVLVWLKYLRYIDKDKLPAEKKDLSDEDKKKLEKTIFDLMDKIDPIDILSSAIPDFDFKNNKLSQAQVLKLFMFIVKLTLREFSAGQGQTEKELIEEQSKKNEIKEE
jgi:hypothetical protein